MLRMYASIIVYTQDKISNINSVIGDIGTLLDAVNGEVI